jgi:hypothetical protein
MNHIGQDFSIKKKLSLFPAAKLPSGYLEINIQYYSESNANTIYCNTSFYASNQNIDHYVIIGKDVRKLNININNIGSLTKSWCKNIDISVHELILLNFASKLLKVK